MRVRAILVLSVGAMACAGQAPDAIPVATVPPNRQPTVSVAAAGCHPKYDQPCTATFTATAADPDHDDLTYSWSGCASGTGATATCAIAEPGSVSAVVDVRDPWDGAARAAATAEGVNQAPFLLLDKHDGVLGNGSRMSVGGRGAIYGQVADPDKDGDPLGICTDIAVRTSGPCAYKKSGCGKYSTYFSVNGTYYEGGDFWVELSAPGGKGPCTVELRARDSWDATTVQQVRITVD